MQFTKILYSLHFQVIELFRTDLADERAQKLPQA